jgi:predicted amidohydrolase
LNVKEQFNCPIVKTLFPIFAEEIPGGETCQALSQAAKENGVYVIGGSFSEKEEGSPKLFNTCVVFDPNGNLVAKHRKVN